MEHNGIDGEKTLHIPTITVYFNGHASLKWHQNSSSLWWFGWTWEKGLTDLPNNGVDPFSFPHSDVTLTPHNGRWR